MEWILWLAAAVALGIAEMFTLTFVLLMFGAGAGAAALAAVLGAPVWIQGLVFALVTVLTLAGIRPWALKLRDSRTGPDADIGLQALEGAEAVVLERVDTDNGLIKVQGQEWTARSFDGEQILEQGEKVNIVEIDGATARVWRQQ